MYEKELLSFIIGSSIFSVVISFFYIGTGFKKSGRIDSFPFELSVIFIPVLFGVINLLNFKIYEIFKNKYISGTISGIIFALILSFIGRFIFDAPVKLFNFNRKNEHLVHFYAIFLYVFIFNFIVNFFNSIYIF